MPAFLQSLRFICVDLLWSIVFFPVWWYVVATKDVLRYCRNHISQANDALAWSLLARNLFRPMYGDYSRTGRAISFGVRLVQWLILSIAMLIVTLIYCLLVILWWLIIPFIGYFVVINLIAVYQ